MTFKNEEEFREHIRKLIQNQAERADEPGLIVDVPYSPNFAPNMYKRIENGDWYKCLIGTQCWSMKVLDSDLLEAVYQAGRASLSQCQDCGIELPYILKLPASQGSPICVDKTECAERVASQAEEKKRLAEKEKAE